MKKRGLEICEASERFCRELLRKELGMAAYAILNQPRIDAALKTADVVADGLYSWEEYLSLSPITAAVFMSWQSIPLLKPAMTGSQAASTVP